MILQCGYWKVLLCEFHVAFAFVDLRFQSVLSQSLRAPHGGNELLLAGEL